MFVVSRHRLSQFLRNGCPAPSELLFKRSAETARVTAKSDEASNRFVATRCGGVERKDRLISVQCALRVLGGVSEQSGSVAYQSLAFQSVASVSASVAVASEFVSVASQSECQAYAFPEYSYPVASASQSTALKSARDEFSSSRIPLVLKALARRAAASKVSRRLRRLEDASSGTVSGCVGRVDQRASGVEFQVNELVSRSQCVASFASASVSSSVQRSLASRFVSSDCPLIECQMPQSHSLSCESSRHAPYAH